MVPVDLNLKLACVSADSLALFNKTFVIMGKTKLD